MKYDELKTIMARAIDPEDKDGSFYCDILDVHMGRLAPELLALVGAVTEQSQKTWCQGDAADMDDALQAFNTKLESL